MDLAIEAEGIRKRYGDTAALDGFDLAVPAGTVHGLLGRNGAGKTTAVRILTTLLRSDAGRATVAGHDVGEQPTRVRERIGLVGQHAAVDEVLTGRQNLVLFGRLHHLGSRPARARAEQLLDQFDLTQAADRPARTYSGGMRRRLDLAASMIGSPRVLFLDEPTAGLDPDGRHELWTAVRALVAAGATVLLTTQYLEEADQLAAQVSVLDRGRVVAAGTPGQLKSRLGAARIDLTVRAPEQLGAAAELLGRIAEAPPEVDAGSRRLQVPVRDHVAALISVAQQFEAAGIGIADLALRQPTLDEVFRQLTQPEAA